MKFHADWERIKLWAQATSQGGLAGGPVGGQVLDHQQVYHRPLWVEPAADSGRGLHGQKCEIQGLPVQDLALGHGWPGEV